MAHMAWLGKVTFMSDPALMSFDTSAPESNSALNSLTEEWQHWHSLRTIFPLMKNSLDEISPDESETLHTISCYLIGSSTRYTRLFFLDFALDHCNYLQHWCLTV